MNISVCMAAYNGERFIHEQLTSILAQLSNDDEIVIVDDASSDETVAIAESFCDERIRILQQGRNCGVIKTFGRALEEAKGEIIFLADQDDIWRTDKILKIKGMFSACPDISLVISNCSIIDADGNITSESWCKSGSFHAGALHNLVRYRYRGCQMAFRRSILGYCLPFPPDIPMHDMWIGIVNQFVGRTGFIDEPLVFYRRHDRNKSPEKHAPIVQMIRWRWALVKNLVLLYARRLALGRSSVTIRNR
ncbi:MAG: glycosyltransferase family 2 protein [Terracidiphilus sp.]